MQRKFLLLLAMCAFTTALPRDKRSVESQSDSESDESVEVKDTVTARSLPSKVIAIKDAADLETRISQAGDKVVFIFFMAPWCPASKQAIPIIEDIAASTENLIVLKFDAPRLLREHATWKFGLKDLSQVPVFIFIKDGKKVEELVGGSADIRGTLSKLMSPSKDSSSSGSLDE